MKVSDKIIYKPQPNKSKQCGQAVLAMLLNESITEICSIMGKKGCTGNKDIKFVLGVYGIGTYYERCKFENKIPNNSVVKIGFNRSKNTHWILKVDDLYYDPEIGIVKKYNKDLVKFISYLNYNVSDYCKDWEPIKFSFVPRESWENESMEGEVEMSVKERDEFLKSKI